MNIEIGTSLRHSYSRFFFENLTNCSNVRKHYDAHTNKHNNLVDQIQSFAEFMSCKAVSCTLVIYTTTNLVEFAALRGDPRWRHGRRYAIQLLVCILRATRFLLQG